MRIFLPFILTPIFVAYIIYLAFVKKEPARQLAEKIVPGAFFILVWGICYLVIIK